MDNRSNNKQHGSCSAFWHKAAKGPCGKISYKIFHDILFLSGAALFLGTLAESILPGILSDKKFFSAALIIAFVSAFGIIRLSPNHMPKDSAKQTLKKPANPVWSNIFFATVIFISAAQIILSARKLDWLSLLITMIAYSIAAVLFFRILLRD